MSERTSTQVRTFEFDVERQAADGAIPVVLSSDAVVEVSDGPEVLVHSPDAIDFRRAPIPIIATHRSGQVNVGIVEGLTVEGGRLRGMAMFGSRPEAAGYREDVLNRIIRSVSVGYARIKATVRKADGVLITSRWMPTHAALVAEPADINAGFFRSIESVPAFELGADEVSAGPSERASTLKSEPAGAHSGPAETIQSPTAAQPQVTQPAAPAAFTRSANMAENQTAAGNTAADPSITIVEDHSNRPTPVEFERSRKQAIVNLCKANRLDGRYERAWIEAGTDLEGVSKQLLDILEERGRNTPQIAATHIDMPQKDLNRYSLMKALRAATNKNWTSAGLELEANREVSKRLGRLPRSETSFFVPLDVMMRSRLETRMQRDMSVAGTSGSNYLVTTENQSGNFIDLLRNTSVGLRMGVRRLSGLVGQVTIPKMTAGTTAYWLTDETTQITEAQPTIAQVALTAKNVAALTEISHQLMQQSTPDAEQLMLDTIARDIALAVDVGIIRGSNSSGQPQGIVGTANVGAFTGTSLAAAGLLDAQADVAAANAINGSCGYVTTPAVAALLMARPELPSTGTTRMWTGNILNGGMLGFPAMSSAQMSTATMLFGAWDTVILGEWGVLELMTNPFSDFTRGLTAVRGWYTCDVAMRYPAAFSYSSSIT